MYDGRDAACGDDAFGLDNDDDTWFGRGCVSSISLLRRDKDAGFAFSLVFFLVNELDRLGLVDKLLKFDPGNPAGTESSFECSLPMVFLGCK